MKCEIIWKHTLKPVSADHLWLHSNPLNAHRWPTYGNHLTLRTSLVQTDSSECTDRRSSWKAGTWYCQWIVTWSNQLPLENSSVLSTLVKKGRRLGGQQAILLINENFDPRTVDTNTVQLFIRPTWEGCSKCDSVVKIQNNHAATLWSNDYV